MLHQVGLFCVFCVFAFIVLDFVSSVCMQQPSHRQVSAAADESARRATSRLHTSVYTELDAERDQPATDVRAVN